MPGQPDRLSEETSKKTCKLCGNEKELKEFYLKSHEGSNRYNKCKSCYTAYIRQYRKEHKEAYNATQKKHWNKFRDRNTIRHKERKYGLERGEFQKLIESQNNQCAICGEGLIGNGHLDHDHETGRVRGILCKQCNTGLGNFRDNQELLQNASKYLRMRQSDLTRKES